MATYTFSLAQHMAYRPVTVRNAAGSTVSTGTLDSDATYSADLPVGDYTATVSHGRLSYTAAGVVDQGDLDRLTESALSSTFARKVALVVAASGGDYTTLTDALAAVPAGGAEILVKRGTHTVSGGIAVPAGTTIRGEGRGSVIKLANAANVSLFNITAADVTIRDLAVDGNRANQSSNSNGIMTTGARTRVVNCYVTSANGYNIVAFPGASRFVVMGCYSDDARDEGIEAQGCNGATITGNTVTGAGKNGIYVYANTTSNAANACKDVAVTGNHVTGSSALSSGYAGIRVDDDAHNVTVTGNVVSGGGTSGRGIVCGSALSGTPVRNCTVTGNTVEGTPSAGIDLEYAHNCAITDNAVRTTGTVGIRNQAGATKTLIANNVVSSVTGSGILMSSGASDVTVVGNTVRDCTQQGIYSISGTQITVDNNTVTNNGASAYPGISFETNGTALTITGNRVDTAGSGGIYLNSGCRGFTISGNTVSACQQAGVYILDCRDGSVTGNTCRNNGIAGNNAAGPGILLRKVSGTTSGIIVTGNRCYDSQGTKTQSYGVNVAGSCDDIVLGPNLLSDNRIANQNIDGTATNVKQATVA